MEKQKVGVKMTVSLEEAVAYLENLLASLKCGSVEVRSGEQCVTLAPAGMVSMEIEAKVKKGKRKLAYELAWIDPAATDVKVGEGEPAAAAPAQAPVKDDGKSGKKAEKESGKKEKKDSGKAAESAEKRTEGDKKSKKDKEKKESKKDTGKDAKKESKKDSKKERKSSKPSAAGDAPEGRDAGPAAGKTPE